MKKILLLVCMAALLAACGNGSTGIKNAADVKKPAEVTSESTEGSGGGFEAAKKLIAEYKVRVNVMTKCEQLSACQMNFTRELDELYKQYEPLSTSESASLQNEIASLGLLISKKKSELGCQ